MSVMTLIASYVPLLYQIYKLSKSRIDSKFLSHSHTSTPSPSISSVSSMTSYSSNHSISPRKLPTHIDRLHDWESKLYSTDNIYQCGAKYFIKAANKQIYGIGHHKNVSLGNNILL
eukprot:738725_1